MNPATEEDNKIYQSIADNYTRVVNYKALAIRLRAVRNRNSLELAQDDYDELTEIIKELNKCAD